jgi:excisionase family DNA binding protein
MTFDQLPAMVAELSTKLDIIEKKLSEPPTPTIEPPIEVPEAAEYLLQNIQTTYRQLSKGELPAHKKGNRWYFFKSELAEWIKSKNG